MFRSSRTYYFLFIVLILSVFSGAVYFLLLPKNTRIIENKEAVFNLLTHWNQGNVVVLIRHAERCDRSDTPCVLLDKKEGITQNGKKMAIKLGQDMQFLWQKDNVVIYHSPVTRTKQTAEFMFNGRSIEKTWLRKDCKKELLNNIFENKPVDKNMILVTHATCIDKLGVKQGHRFIHDDILNDDTYGIAFFLAVNKKEHQAYMLGYLKPQDWKYLSKQIQK